MVQVTWSDLPQEILDIIFAHVVGGAHQTQLRTPDEYTGLDSKLPRIATHKRNYYVVTMPTTERLVSSFHAGALLCNRFFNRCIRDAVRRLDPKWRSEKTNAPICELDCTILIPTAERWYDTEGLPPLEVCIAWTRLCGYVGDRPARFEINYRVLWEDFGGHISQTFHCEYRYDEINRELWNWYPHVEAVIQDVARYAASPEPWPSQLAVSEGLIQIIPSTFPSATTSIPRNNQVVRSLTFNIDFTDIDDPAMEDYDFGHCRPMNNYRIWQIEHRMVRPSEEDPEIARWLERMFATMKTVEHDPRPWQDRVNIRVLGKQVEHPKWRAGGYPEDDWILDGFDDTVPFDPRNCDAISVPFCLRRCDAMRVLCETTTVEELRASEQRAGPGNHQ